MPEKTFQGGIEVGISQARGTHARIYRRMCLTLDHPGDRIHWTKLQAKMYTIAKFYLVSLAEMLWNSMFKYNHFII